LGEGSPYDDELWRKVEVQFNHHLVVRRPDGSIKRRKDWREALRLISLKQLERAGIVPLELDPGPETCAIAVCDRSKDEFRGHLLADRPSCPAEAAAWRRSVRAAGATEPCRN
jgi:hypothetical protein